MNLENSQDYYGKVLAGSSDLKTDACCTMEAPPPEILSALRNVHEEVKARYYGCGLVAPQAIAGCHVLDLGSGSGQDAYILAQLVGSEGSVTGVDATPEQLAVARGHEDWHRQRFGYDKSNVRFLEGDIEKLGDLDLPEGHFDVIVSNCVINLVADKRAVFEAAHRLLKPGGELYFSDVYSERRVPEHLRDDPVLHGECLSGALYWADYQAIAREAGFLDPRVVSHRPLAIMDAGLQDKLDPIRFASVTARLMKLDDLEPACEDYGQAVIYKGGVKGMERVFKLDTEHEIEVGRIFPVCGNTLAMLRETRFAPYFEVVGDGATHYGLFPGCAAPDVFAPVEGEAAASAGGCC